MARRSRIQVPAWVPRWLGNLLLIGLVIYAAAGLAWMTWFMRLVPTISRTAPQETSQATFTW